MAVVAASVACRRPPTLDSLSSPAASTRIAAVSIHARLDSSPSGADRSTMNGLIRASLKNPIAVTVMVLALVVLGGLAAYSIPVDILPVFKSPAVQTLVFYSGMPAASIEKNITARLERGVGQASGGRRLESRSIVGISIVRDYFRSNVDRSGALTEVNSLAGWEYPTMPPGTLPPVVLPYDPTSATPVCLVALDSPTAERGDPLRRRPVRGPAADHVAARARSRRWSTAARSARS